MDKSNITFLHILFAGNIGVVNEFPPFILDNFSKDDHYFVVIGISDNGKLSKYKGNVEYMPKYDYFRIHTYINHSEHVIVHSMCLSTITKISILLNSKKIKKIVWVAWGKDLYEADITNAMTLRNCVDKRFKEKISYFVGIFPPDIDYFKSKYGDYAKCFYAKYGAARDDDARICIKPPRIIKISEKVARQECINIIIGHQANPLLNHMSVLERLEKFREENIHIYIPLSYGDKSNADEVERYAKQLFDYKVTIFRDLMPLKEYNKILENMDIAIFDIKRQIGLGNIWPLLYMQKKIYLNSDGVMYNFFKKDNIQIQDTKDLSTIDFNTLISDPNMSGATDFVVDSLDFEKNVEQWDHVFLEVSQQPKANN